MDQMIAYGMIMRKSYKFLLRPTKKQMKLLQQTLDECRWLYNQLLEQRKLSYEELDLSLTKYQQLMMLPELKHERVNLDNVHSQVLQEVVARLDKAFQNFFRRCKNGEKPGFPRFRNFYRYNSFCYPQSGFAIEGNQLKLGKIGNIRIKQHRKFEGKVKTCSLIKDASGNWHVSLSCEVEAKPLPLNEKAVGIDVGLEKFAVLTDGSEIENPRFFKTKEKELAKAQRKLSKMKEGTAERRKCSKVVSKIHESIRNKRSDFCHKNSRKIVNEYQYICVEDLNIKKMMQETYLAKSIADASWNQFCQFLSYKAEEAGRKLGLVNPAYTSQRCSQCGNIKRKELSERQHCCSKCGYTVHRDFNASQNILALGLDGLGISPRSPHL